ncbi:hypothetical protein EGK_03142 [Macaca mulatta]|uniref:Uncharacterized protein n=2 Tax=Macaca TaxID=9539 RepID=G7N463_MACMU|nr:hypothetical protein EGK_03142 [Macaca mulatta]EHH65919.1 hypothetical protein EGM_02785 [Macaca fascicularis]
MSSTLREACDTGNRLFKENGQLHILLGRQSLNQRGTQCMMGCPTHFMEEETEAQKIKLADFLWNFLWTSGGTSCQQSRLDCFTKRMQPCLPAGVSSALRREAHNQMKTPTAAS